MKSCRRRLAAADHSVYMSTPQADLCAGWCVGKGALHAGTLSKRSDWLGKFNERFFVLTSDELAWFKGSSVDELTCAAWCFGTRGPSGERRALAIAADLKVVIASGTLTITSPGSATLVLRAASEAELQSWHAALSALIDALAQDTHIAFAFVRERAALFEKAFAEHPACGSRNHLSRGIAKTFYTIHSPAAKGDQWPGLRFLSSSSHANDPLIFSLTALPPPMAAWPAEQCAAFHEVMSAIADAGHPTLLPPAHAELLPGDAKYASIRPLLPCGSIKDVVASVHNPRARYARKYARLASASERGTAREATLEQAGQAAIGSSHQSGGSGQPESPLWDGTAALLPLTDHRIALFGRQVLEGLRFLRACGMPATHVHGGNVLLRRISVPSGAPADSGWACHIVDFENALLGLPSFAQQHRLAQPVLAAGTTTGFAIPRDVIAFGHTLHLMAVGTELTEAQIALATAAHNLGRPSFAGPPAAVSILEKIFLPSLNTARGPTLVDLLAEPFFSVALPSSALRAATVPAPVFRGAAAALLKSSRKRTGGDVLMVAPPGASASGSPSPVTDLSSSPLSGRLETPSRQLPPVVVIDAPNSGRPRKAAARTFTFDDDAAPLGLCISADGHNRAMVGELTEGGQASALGVPLRGLVLGINGHSVKEVPVDDVLRLLEAASFPLVLRVQPPRQRGDATKQRAGLATPGPMPTPCSAGGAASSASGAAQDSEPRTPASAGTISRFQRSDPPKASSAPATEAEAHHPVEDVSGPEDAAASSGSLAPALPAKYVAMLKAGVPRRGVQQEMIQAGIDELSADDMLRAWKASSSPLGRRRSTSLDDEEGVDGGQEDRGREGVSDGA